MFRLVFDSETVEFLVPNAPGHFVQEEKSRVRGEGGTSSLNAQNYKL
jgi:hypothetical protein